jgi:hypothetical protein
MYNESSNSNERSRPEKIHACKQVQAGQVSALAPSGRGAMSALSTEDVLSFIACTEAHERHCNLSSPVLTVLTVDYESFVLLHLSLSASIDPHFATLSRLVSDHHQSYAMQVFLEPESSQGARQIAMVSICSETAIAGQKKECRGTHEVLSFSDLNRACVHADQVLADRVLCITWVGRVRSEHSLRTRDSEASSRHARPPPGPISLFAL